MLRTVAAYTAGEEAVFQHGLEGDIREPVGEK